MVTRGDSFSCTCTLSYWSNLFNFTLLSLLGQPEWLNSTGNHLPNQQRQGCTEVKFELIWVPHCLLGCLWIGTTAVRKQRGENHALPMRAWGTEKTCQQVCVGMVACSFVLHRGCTVGAQVCMKAQNHRWALIRSKKQVMWNPRLLDEPGEGKKTTVQTSP